MTSTVSNETAAAVRFLDELFAPAPPVNAAVLLWDGTRWPDAAPRSSTFVLKHPGSLRRMFGAGTEKGLAEAYLHDDFDVTGDLEAACEIADTLAAGAGWKRSFELAHLLHKLPDGPGPKRSDAAGRGPARARLLERLARRHSRERDRHAIAFHYDVSNDFYRLWLDRRMVYSCAYFETAQQELDAAQAAKLDYLCRKLRLRPGQEVLDVGCGWGGFALYAAQHRGVRVTAITLSEQQAAFASARAAEAGLGDRVSVECRDYRALPEGERFDAAVSVGMSEHVGRNNLPDYFATVFARLKPGGAFLNHAIGEGCRYRPSEGPSFIDEYVFPDSDIPPVQAVAEAAASAGFDVRDAENLREHYALTLRHWVRRLEARHGESLAHVDEATYRVWRLYMAGSARAFACARLGIYQLLLSKPDGRGDSRLPLTRADWYQAGEPDEAPPRIESPPANP